MKRDEKTNPAVAPDCKGKRVALVAARFYRELSDELVSGARAALRECGVADGDVTVVDVPGCFEIPLACRKLNARNRYDAIVALGVVVRGETPHFDFVAGQCAAGVMQVQLATGMPIGFGVLTTENLDQAHERAARDRGDKGYEAAMAAAALLALDNEA